MLRQCTFLYAAHLRISRCFFGGSRNQIMVFVTTELFNPIQHTCSVFIVVVVVVLFCFAYQTHCFFVVVIAVAVMAVLSLI